MAASPKYVHFDQTLLPIEQAQVSIQDRGLLLGDGLFETVLCNQGHPLFLKEHWMRLQHSAQCLRIPLPTHWDQFQQDVQQLLLKNHINIGVLRVTLTRGPRTQPGLNLYTAASPTFLMEVHPYMLPTQSSWKLRLSSIRRSEHSEASKHKTLGYAENLLAYDEAQQAGYDEALFCVEQNKVQCGTRSNVFMIQGNTLVTPPLTLAVLPGIMRHIVLKTAASQFEIQESAFSWNRLFEADEVFMTNSLIGIMPVSQFESHHYTTQEKAQTLKQLLFHHYPKTPWRPQ